MSEDEIYQRKLAKILDFISSRARTVFEVERKLDKLIVGDVVKARIMEELGQLKLLSDSRYAKDYLNEKINSSRPVGPNAVKKFLYRKGVSPELIKDTVSDFSTEDESKAIEKLLDRKMRVITKRDLKTKNRIIKFLLYRGFSSKTVFTAVDTKFEVK